MARAYRMLAIPLLLLATLGVVAPGAARASYYLVDPNGGGDFTTIQAALDQQMVEWRDEVLIKPGVYPSGMQVTLWAPHYIGRFGDTGVVQVGVFGIDPDLRRELVFDHITFQKPIEENACANLLFWGCRFIAGVSCACTSYPPRFIDCDFYGRTSLFALENHGYPVLESSRFHNAPLGISTTNGDIVLRDCLFEGPTDTLLYIEHADEDDPVRLEDCSFENARQGVVLASGWGRALTASGCNFRDLSDAGVWFEASYWQRWRDLFPTASGISNSRFEKCGTALHWKGIQAITSSEDTLWTGVSLALSGVTVLSSAHNGLDVGPLCGGEIRDCVIDGSGENGALVRQEHPPWSPGREGPSLLVTNSMFTNNHGTGLVMRDSASAGYVGDFGPSSHVVNGCSFSGNDGRGLEISCGSWHVEMCIALANGRDGFAWSTSAPTLPIRLSLNTSALNRGDGFLATGPSGVGDSLQFVEHNLAVMNAGAGLRLSQYPAGSLAFNDAWGNYAGQYVGPASPADSNLTVDPRFCDLSAGLAGLGLQQGSPVGPAGIYGLIGARPEECASVTAVPTPAPGTTLAFAVRPSVARGSVEFAVPAGQGEGRVEVFDVSGRILWRASSGSAGGVVRWQGESADGRAHTGLYWVRFTRGSDSATRRLVWME